jgi:hypothetical protein
VRAEAASVQIASIGGAYGTTSTAIPFATAAKLLEPNYQLNVTHYPSEFRYPVAL